jgi:2'-5' RNA ligase
MIRLFIAIDIAEDIRMLICNMGGSIPGAKSVPSSQIHLTLKFLGDTESSLLDEIVYALAAIEHEPITIAIRSVGHFPPRGAPRVIWTGIHPVHNVVKLRNKVEKTLVDIGIERDKRKFSPHITLARLKNSPISRVTRFLADNSMLETPPFSITEFQLYSSTLSQKGAIHIKEATFPLR